jgi:hypothetical protein
LPAAATAAAATTAAATAAAVKMPYLVQAVPAAAYSLQLCLTVEQGWLFYAGRTVTT